MIGLTDEQSQQAFEVATRALAFTDSQQATLPSALIRYLWFDGSAEAVIAALAEYQNDDGGFGNRLEVDIHAPVSNPFAARLAMQVLAVMPSSAGRELRSALKQWLIDNQSEDGDWHFSEEVKAGFLQPWFAAWEFPALNPACCVAGYAKSLGLDTDQMMTRVAVLFADKASLTQVQEGGFYDLLPYVEYSRGVELPASYLDTIASSIARRAETNDMEDAEHFFTLTLNGSPEITARLPHELYLRYMSLLLTEPLNDGGWPTPYDEAWRPWTTANNLITLARLRDIGHEH